MLWKKEKGIYENISVYPDQMPRASTEVKDNDNSSFLRKLGNISFQSNDFLDAIDMYGASLILAENGTEAISLAYANRSAGFFHLQKYDKCLVDIELAKKAGHTGKFLKKIESREADCLKFIEQNAQIESPTPTLDYEPNEKFPCMADVLEINFDEKFGRLIKAKCDIPAGKIVLLERAEMKLYFRYKHKECCWCLKNHTNTVPCKKCTLASFCYNDEKCLNNSYHKIECGMEMVSSDDTLSCFKMDVIRSILVVLDIFPNAKDLVEFVENAISSEKATRIAQNITDDRQMYEAFLQLWYSKNLCNEPWFSMLVELVHRALMKKSIIKKKFSSVKLQRFLMHLIGHHFCIIYCNRGGIGNDDSNECVYVTDESLAIISSYINHSCAPNIDIIPGDDFKLCVTIRPIKKGEQLFVSYFRNDTKRRSMNNKSRGDNLQKMFDFKCECERCIDAHPTAAECNAIKKDEALNAIRLNTKAPSKYSESESTMMMTKCLEFLNKYGGLKWTPEMEIVGERYIEVLARKYRSEAQFLTVE